MIRTIAVLLCLLCCGQLSAQMREWCDPTGNFKMKADLIARNNTSVVLQGEDKSLLIVDVDQLHVVDPATNSFPSSEWVFAVGLAVVCGARRAIQSIESS